MPIMGPDLSEAQLSGFPPKLHAEAKFYRACRDHLPERILVYYSIQTLNERMVEGEADFVLFDPERGMLVVEVKGGGITFDPASGMWTSTDREGQPHPIHDPFRQARERSHDLRRYIAENERFKKHLTGRITAGYAVSFPHLSTRQVDEFKRPDIQRNIIGSNDDLPTLEEWVSAAFDAWQKPGDVALGRQGRGVVETILCGPVHVRPLLSAKLRDEEEVRVQLTEQQKIVLESLGNRDRFAVSGGAGTGKTLLAMAQADRVAREGFKALLLCYNRPLSDHLKDVTGSNGSVHPQQIHQFYEWWVGTVHAKHGHNFLHEADERHPGKDRFDVHLPDAFSSAVEECEAPFYDAIIVDEGQDFRDNDWVALMALIEQIKAKLYVFYDHNQRLYRRSEYFPVPDERDRLRLSRNCRNTTHIHRACYRFYEGPETRCPPIDGEPIACITGETFESQARQISEKAAELITKEEVRPDDVAILVLGAGGEQGQCFSALNRRSLPAGVQWVEGVHRRARTILVDTVARFKGLERTIVFLWLGMDIDASVHREFIYVGMSRAKGRLFLVGTEAACRAALAGAPPNAEPAHRS